MTTRGQKLVNLVKKQDVNDYNKSVTISSGTTTRLEKLEAENHLKENSHFVDIFVETQTYFQSVDTDNDNVALLQNVLFPIPPNNNNNEELGNDLPMEVVDDNLQLLNGCESSWVVTTEDSSSHQVAASNLFDEQPVDHINSPYTPDEYSDPYRTDDDSDKDPDFLPDEVDKQDASQIQTILQMEDTENNIIEDVLVNKDDNETDILNVKEKVRKRKQNMEEWRRNVIKKKRNCGEEYKNWKGKIVPARELKPPCPDSCRLKCKTKITEEERENLRSRYWQLADVDKQREFILRFVMFHTKKRVRKTKLSGKDGDVNASVSRRTYTFEYTLPKNEFENIKVCQTFFLNTLVISHQVVKTVLKKKVENQGIIGPDKRGKIQKNSRLPDNVKDTVRNHINSFPTIESHYCRKNTSRKYLCSSLNQSKLYQLYLEYCTELSTTPVSEATYRQIFNYEFNLSFFVPKKDQCDLCNKYKQLEGDEKKKMEQQIGIHMKNKELARKEKDNDKNRALEDSTFCAAVFDLEQVLQSPKAETSKIYYKRKLSSYNLTIFEFSSKQGFCYMWHEGIAKRGACEIGSCVAQFLLNKIKEGIKEFSLFSDNCGGQNRNRFIFIMYLYFCNKYNIKITHKFLESGHTQNEGDSIHSVIERASKNVPIYCPNQWYTLVRTAAKKKPYIVGEMSQSDIWDLKDMLKKTTINWEKDLDGNKICWNSVRIVTVDPSEKDMIKIKTNFSDESIQVINVCQKGRKKIANILETYTPKQLYTTPIPIPKLKYQDLHYMCREKIIPVAYHEFYNSLVCGNTANSDSESE